MRRWIVIGAVAGTAAAAAALARRRDGESEGDRRWNAVTILGSDDLVRSDAPPPPLDALAGEIDWAVSPAPGGRGVELRARPTSSAADPGGTRRSVRSALREAKQLLEVGEVLRHDPVSGRRPATPTGKLVDVLARRSGEEGVL